MSVKDVALAAWNAEHERLKEVARVEAERERAKERERIQRGAYVLEHSPLSEWFPDATFNVVAYTGVGTSLQYVSDGSQIIVKSDDNVYFGLSMDLRDSEFSTPGCQVWAVDLEHQDNSDAYYSGPRVQNALEVGYYLKGGRP